MISFRQSILRTFDACPQAALWEHEVGHADWSTPEQALGTVFHSICQEMVETMCRTDMARIPTEEAMVIAYEVLARPDTPILSTVQMRDLKIMVLQFSSRRWDPSKVVGLEMALESDLECPDGVIRRLTGHPDLVTADPPVGMIVVDYKSGRDKPPQPRHPEDPAEWLREDGRPYLSERGVFQLDAYGLLVMDHFPAVEYCMLREFHARSGLIREAILRREDLEHVRKYIALHLMNMDRIVSGVVKPLARPGAWCKMKCPRPAQCPIDPELRRVGQLITNEDAADAGSRYAVADAQRHRAGDALKAYLTSTDTQAVETGYSWVGWRDRPAPSQVATVHERQACPKCHAPVGHQCQRPTSAGWSTSGTPLKNSHRERVEADGIDYATSSRTFGIFPSDPSIAAPTEED